MRYMAPVVCDCYLPDVGGQYDGGQGLGDGFSDDLSGIPERGEWSHRESWDIDGGQLATMEL